ncbi:MAG: hypothetical protein R3310_12545, partial [Candidatus Competibacteraceae bacterium]|nr:hypothetical protein [Candidatus Competibacteraceae bacterium]
MDQLFMVLSARYGHKWNSQLPEDAGALGVFREEWRTGLRGLRWGDIKRGLERWRQSVQGRTWPPNLEELREAARLKASDLGIPDAEQAYVDACHRRWSHAIVFLACQEVGGSLQMQAAHRQLR